MNATEKRYAVERIESLAYDAGSNITARSIVEPLSSEQMVKLLQAGKVKVKKNPDTPRYGVYISNLFDWTPFLSKPELSERQADVKKAKLAVDVQKIEDAIMLGDSKTALESINKFAERCEKL